MLLYMAMYTDDITSLPSPYSSLARIKQVLTCAIPCFVVLKRVEVTALTWYTSSQVSVIVCHHAICYSIRSIDDRLLICDIESDSVRYWQERHQC